MSFVIEFPTESKRGRLGALYSSRRGMRPGQVQPIAQRKQMFDRLFTKDSQSGCWNWLGSKTTAGYGLLRVNTRWMYAHRAAYSFKVGPIPKGMCVCHHCDNKGCVNPGHLFIGTANDNNQDMFRKGRNKRGSKYPTAKLTEASAVKVFRSGLPQRVIAALFGIAQSTVSKIKSGSRYKEEIKQWQH